METTEPNRKISLNDFSLICRACLNREGLKPFQEVSSSLHLFKSITDIQVELNDELPTSLCYKCLNKLEEISAFITASKNNDKYFKDILSEKNKCEYFEDNNSQSDLAIDSEIDEKFEGNVDCKIKKSDNIDDSIKIQEVTITPGAQINKRARSSIKVQPHICKVCNEYFITKKKLVEHQRKNPHCKIREYKCNNCEKEFFTKFRLKVHMRCHTKETPYECKICLKKFRHAPNLNRHNDIIHKGMKPFKCEVCGKEFATFLRRTEHLRIHTGERPHICTYCGMGFKKHSTHYAHEIRHKIKNGEIPKSDKKAKKYPRKKPTDPSELECDFCKKSFSSKQARLVHKQIHLGNKSFLCTVCGKGFLRKSHLEVHMRIHTGERPYECDNCGKNFRQAACFRNHMLIHKGQRSFKCDTCERTFVQLGHLQCHLKTHSGEKPYQCIFCEKRFAVNGNLKTHMRIHTGERPYRCSICYMGFHDSTSMKKHQKTHSEVGTIFS